MNKEEFFNFLSLLYAFKDVVIGEDLIETEDLEIINKIPRTVSQEPLLPIPEKNNDFKEEIEKEELNPEEWDPW